MLLLGLTGSIATGKSTVSSLLSTAPYNLPIIDADKLAREVVEPGTPAYLKIVEHFAPTTPDLLLPASQLSSSDGNDGGMDRPLNRSALGRRVFGTTPDRVADRQVLNRIVHPAVRVAMLKKLVWAYASGAGAVVLDVPLLFESGWDGLCGTVVVVGVRDRAVQIARLRRRDGEDVLSEEGARERVESQVGVTEKAERALRRGEETGWGAVVWNDGDKAELEREVERVMRVVEKKSPAWWSWACLLMPPVGLAAGLWSLWWSQRSRRLWIAKKEAEKAKL